MINISFSPEDIEALKYERYQNAHPRVRQKIWVVWLKACDLPHREICRIADVTENTVRAYLNEFVEGGLPALKQVRFNRPKSELDEYREILRDEFETNPAASVAEARATIARLTGIERSPTQVRHFLYGLGMSFRKVAVVPAKADPQVQEVFKKNSSNHG